MAKEDMGRPGIGPSSGGGGGILLPILLLAIGAGLLAFFTHPDVVKQESEPSSVTGTQ